MQCNSCFSNVIDISRSGEQTEVQGSALLGSSPVHCPKHERSLEVQMAFIQQQTLCPAELRGQAVYPSQRDRMCQVVCFPPWLHDWPFSC